MSVQSPLTTSEPQPSTTPSKPRGSWRRRIFRALVVVIVLAFALRVMVFFALRPTLRRVSEAYGVWITFDRQELTLVGGDVGLWGLKVFPKGSDKPLMACDYVRGNIEAL